MIYRTTNDSTQHIAIEDIEMADPDASPDAGPDAPFASLEAHLWQIDRDMYEQAWWVKGSLCEPLQQMRKIAETLTGLSRRMDNLEQYLGLQDSAQPLVLFDGVSHHTYYEDESGD